MLDPVTGKKTATSPRKLGRRKQYHLASTFDLIELNRVFKAIQDGILGEDEVGLSPVDYSSGQANPTASGAKAIHVLETGLDRDVKVLDDGTVNIVKEYIKEP